MGNRGHPEWKILLLLFPCLIIVTIWGAQQGCPLCPCFLFFFFFQISPYNNLVLLAAISVLHSEL